MKQLIYFLVVIAFFTGCKKDPVDPVEIYVLKSFKLTLDQTGPHPITIIADAVLDNVPIISNNEIDYYTKSTTTFNLKKDIRAVLLTYGADKAFVITINKAPVYYGKFHPAYLSSIAFGIATIDPILINGTALKIEFNKIAGNNDMLQFDMRNDPRLLKALSNSGRLR